MISKNVGAPQLRAVASSTAGARVAGARVATARANSAALTDIFSSQIDQVPIASGTIRIPIMAKNDEFTLSIKASSPLPIHFLSGEWDLLHFTKARTR